MVHGLLHLLQQAVHRSQWLDPVEAPDQEESVAEAAQALRTQKKIYTH